MLSEILEVFRKHTVSNQLPEYHSQLHLATLVLLIAVASNSFVLPCFAAAPHTPQVAFPQATSTVPSNDDRVGALWEAIDPNDPTKIVKRCSANHLGNGFWITAHHCIASNPSMQGFIKQDDGDQVPIKEIFTKSKNDDVALIKVEDGIQAQRFTLPSRAPYVGEELSLIGYANTNTFASIAQVQAVEEISEFDTGWFIYNDLIKTKSITMSRSCDGDSGGAVFFGNTIYAIHTAGIPNRDCIHAQGSNLWHTNLYSRVGWIESIFAQEKGKIGSIEHTSDSTQ